MIRSESWMTKSQDSSYFSGMVFVLLIAGHAHSLSRAALLSLRGESKGTNHV
jgi:hypothetical protein